MRTPGKMRAFTTRMLASIPSIFTRAIDNDRGNAEDRAWASLLGHQIPDLTVPPRLTRDERFGVNMFRGFTEIHACIERLKDCETYISRYPFAKTRVTRAAYLQLVVEIHLHELHILQERIISYLKQIERAYKADARASQIKKSTTYFEKRVADHLGSLTKIRGKHVHELRYEHPAIDRLRLADLLLRGPDPIFTKKIRNIRRDAIRDSHSKLKVQARAWNNVVNEICNELFDGLIPVLFAADGKAFLFPAPVKRG